MRSIGVQGWGLQRDMCFAVFQRALTPAALLTGMLAGCAAPTHYMGIDISQPELALASSASYSEMSTTALARMAHGGDKHAQLEFGIRFEEGKGVERDICNAAELYDLARRSEQFPDIRVTTFASLKPSSRGTSKISRMRNKGSLQAAKLLHRLRSKNALMECENMQ